MIHSNLARLLLLYHSFTLITVTVAICSYCGCNICSFFFGCMGLQTGSATGGFSPDDTHGAAWSGGRNYFQCGAALRSSQLGASYFAGTVRDAGVK